MCFSKDVSTYDMESHAELSIKDHAALIELFKQGNDLEAIKVISEHVKLFQRRVNHFMLPSLDILDAISHEIKLPIVAIGGINEENAALPLEHGASGIAVISALRECLDPKEAASRLRAAVDKAKKR